jgi:multimeric flavodoxin WrbA
MKILGIQGSPRRRGNTCTIMDSMLSGAESVGAQTQLVQLYAYSISGCIVCERCRKDKTCTQFLDGMHLLYPLIEEADALILGSPTYNYKALFA